MVFEGYVLVFEGYVLVFEEYVLVFEGFVLVFEVYVLVFEVYVLVIEGFVLVCEVYVLVIEGFVLVIEGFVLVNIFFLAYTNTKTLNTYIICCFSTLTTQYTNSCRVEKIHELSLHELSLLGQNQKKTDTYTLPQCKDMSRVHTYILL